jgi:eukaryotic-like serine/threonine-protein kinase
MAFLQKLRAFGQGLLVVFILASAAFLSAVTAIRFAIEGRQVQMPTLVGQKQPDAEKLLLAQGLGLRIEDRVYSAYPEDVIVRQSPPAGLRVKVGERAHVVLSLGPQRVRIPDLREASLRAARIQLMRDGLQMGETSSLYLQGLPGDTVVEQDPPAGTLDVTSPHVDLLVSQGDEPGAWVMPSLTGISQSEAARVLEAAGLKNVKIVSTGVPPAAAPAINPQAPGTAPADAAVSSQSAAQPPPANPPSAQQTPGAPVAMPLVASGTVLGQTPAEGARVTQDTAIELRVAQ